MAAGWRSYFGFWFGGEMAPVAAVPPDPEDAIYYLGGMTVVKSGWVNPMTVYLDFVSQYTSGWLWQLYCNRKLVGATRLPGERRVYGQIVPSVLPAPLTLVRVPESNVLFDYADHLPRAPWTPCNQFKLRWSTANMPADTDHFDVVVGGAPRNVVDLSIPIARVPFAADGVFEFEVPPADEIGLWALGIVPRDNALPLGNAGATVFDFVDVVTPPPDIQFDEAAENRFTVAISAGVVTASFVY